ncbi:MAG: response regulator [Planctomycetaceae bacterium]|nr:response regulator [Planctomycetaceae bacterium]
MPTFLIVDDSPIDLRLASSVLEKVEGAVIVSAANGMSALDQVVIEKPDVIVTDIQMPDMNGLQLVLEVRRRFPNLPVVLMTARGSEDLAGQALEAGAAGYVPKRRLLQDLAPTVERALSITYIHRQTSRVLQRLHNQESSFVVENDLEVLLSLATHLRDTVHTIWRCDPVQVLRIGMALEESLVNACLHGNLELDSELREADEDLFQKLSRQRTTQSPYCERRIFVDAQCTPDLFQCAIRDEGNGFDPSQLPDLFSEDSLERTTGRGLTLIRSFMDEVQFNDRGNEILLLKRRAMLPSGLLAEPDPAVMPELITAS